MYLVEGPDHGYDSMFRGVYWSIVTMSTVGYGDITPSTPFGQVLAAMLMIIGYSVIAVPTGIVSAEVVGARRPGQESCRSCGSAVHRETARFCDACGSALIEPDPVHSPVPTATALDGDPSGSGRSPPVPVGPPDGADRSEPDRV